MKFAAIGRTPVGVDIITGQGLEAAVKGADVIVNLTNSPTFDDFVNLSIARATQFMEFMGATLARSTEGDTVRLPRTPLGGTINIAGPDVYPLDELGRLTLTRKPGGRSILTAPSGARILPTRYTDWLV